jgi:acyl carrier protein
MHMMEGCPSRTPGWGCRHHGWIPEEKRMASIEQEIFAIVKEKLAVNEVTRTTTLQELGADSLDVVEVLMEVESRLGVAIPDQEASNMKTIGEVIEYVEKHRKSVPA